jgi:TonB family protein
LLNSASCSWPADAEDEDFDHQLVRVSVVVTAAGRVESVDVLDDPGRGFAAAAQACVRTWDFAPARDRDGRPMRSRLSPVSVRFMRWRVGISDG